MTELKRTRVVRFDEAIEQARNVIVNHHVSQYSSIVIVRDLHGLIRIALDTNQTEKDTALAEDLHRVLGAYSPGMDAILLYKSDLFDPSEVFDSPDKIQPWEGTPIYLLDRQLIGREWLAKLDHIDSPETTRVTLYGIKGGVGRSTALAVWASYLANLGKRVLVVDMDLESPGVGSTLLDDRNQPEYGVADWLVEDAVGQADDELLRDMVASSAVSGTKGGVVRVAPANGRNLTNYIAKLSRSYLDITRHESSFGFSIRIDRMLKQLESYEHPDFVLIDSRAGIHDIAAAAITQLNAQVFMFAVDSPQTWNAYRMLFSYWQKYQSWKIYKNQEDFRYNLKMVAAMIPEIGRTEYMNQFRINSYDLWVSLYEQKDDELEDLFNFDLDFLEAPHYPLEINWNRGFQEFYPLISGSDSMDPSNIEKVFGSFLREATRLITADEAA